ncbi:MAG: hypothetical protein L0312_30970 [Acidobacteria bacterium]|nr:hypothetical protein [Acidobacteriota bacterium]
MNKLKRQMNDDLRPEYDLRELRVRRFGPARRSFGGTLVLLEPEVAEKFPDASAVNEALRFLIRIAREKESTRPLRRSEGDPSGTTL